MNLTVFIPAICKDIGRLILLLKSMDKYMNVSDDIRFLILTPDVNDIKYVISMFRNLSIKMIHDTNVYAYDRQSTRGWERQQVYKLLISRYIDTNFYLILDCDCFAVRQFSCDDLLRGGRAIMDYQSIEIFSIISNRNQMVIYPRCCTT